MHQFSAEWCSAAADRIAELESQLAAADASARLMASTMDERLAAAEAERDNEKERRIHWQGLAYTGMRVVDAVLNNHIALGEGTTEESMQINSRMAIDKMNHLRSEWAAKAGGP